MLLLVCWCIVSHTVDGFVGWPRTSEAHWLAANSGDRTHENLHFDWLATSLPPPLHRPQPSTFAAGPSGQLSDHISKL